MSTPYGNRALRREEAKVRRTADGQRNTALAKASFKCGQLVGGGELDEHLAEEALIDAGLACGLPDHEAELTVRSCLATGKDHPRQAPPPITCREEALRLLDDYERAVLDRRWPGQNGPLHAIVLHTVIGMARQAGGPRDVPAGVRRIAALSGVQPSRVSAALHHLRERGLLRLAKRARRGNPNHYHLTLPPQEDRP